MDSTIHMTFASSLENIRQMNSSFDAGVLKICYPGKNRNDSYFQKEDLVRCLPSMFNCPVVCNYDRETDTIGGHDVELVHGDDGYKLVNKTVPVGVIPESARTWFEECEEEDGTIHEYLFADALLWKRQEAYEKLARDGITSQSMEIHVNDGERVDGVYHIKDFEFTAFTLIGIEPCFESASLTLENYSAEDRETIHSELKREVSEMMRDLKESFNLVSAPGEESGDDNKPTHNTTKGGDEVLEEKMKLLEEFGKKVEDLDFSIDDMSVEDLRARLTSLAEEPEAAETDETEQAEQNVGEPEETAHEDEPGADTEQNGAETQEQFELQGNVREWLYEAVEALGTVETEYGWSYPLYWMLDYDPETGTVYCEDSRDWKIYGFSYTMDGDRPVIDAESKKRMKREYVEFEGGEQDSAAAGLFALMSEKMSELNAKSDEYRTASETVASLEAELAELRQFKADIEAEKNKAMKESLASRFSDIAETEAFTSLMEHSDEYSCEELEDKCFAIRGRMMTQTSQKFGLNQQTSRVIVDKTPEERKPYGGIVERYSGTDR